MPINIDVHEGGDRTALLMLVATIGLVFAAAAQAFAAFLQSAAANRQAQAAEKQAAAADRQARSAEKAIVASITSLDDAAMPFLEYSQSMQSPPHLWIRVRNSGVGTAQHITLGKIVGTEFIADPNFLERLPASHLLSDKHFELSLTKNILTEDGGLGVRYESSQHSQTVDRVVVETHTGLIRSERITKSRPYAAHNFLD
jgi:hypothetical protein